MCRRNISRCRCLYCSGIIVVAIIFWAWCYFGGIYNFSIPTHDFFRRTVRTKGNPQFYNYILPKYTNPAILSLPEKMVNSIEFLSTTIRETAAAPNQPNRA